MGKIDALRSASSDQGETIIFCSRFFFFAAFEFYVELLSSLNARHYLHATACESIERNPFWNHLMLAETISFNIQFIFGLVFFFRLEMFIISETNTVGNCVERTLTWTLEWQLRTKCFDSSIECQIRHLRKPKNWANIFERFCRLNRKENRSIESEQMQWRLPRNNDNIGIYKSSY